MAGTKREHVGTLPVRAFTHIVQTDRYDAFLPLDRQVEFVNTIRLVDIGLGKKGNKDVRVINGNVNRRVEFFCRAQSLFIDPAGKVRCRDQARDFSTSSRSSCE